MEISKDDNFIKKLALSFYKGQQCNISSEDIQNITYEKQKEFLKLTIQTPHFRMYPMRHSFCILFFKKLVQYLEHEHEIHDEIYDFIGYLMQSNGDMFSYRHYVIKNDLDNIIIIKETNNIVVNGTTGLKTWEAALMLSDWALYNGNIFFNKNILELGSGVGFTGTTIAKQCNIKSMVMTDCHREVLKTINDNIHINFPSAYQNHKHLLYNSGTKTIGAMMLDWNDIEDLSLPFIPDIVIGADVVYDPSILKTLINVFTRIHKLNNNIDIYIASVIRNNDTFNEFLEILELLGFNHLKIPLTNYGYIEWNESIERSLLKINKR